MENQYLDDFDPNKFVAKMGAECIMDLLARIDLMNFLIVYVIAANNETSKTTKNRSIKTFKVVESFRESNLNRETVQNG